MMKRILALLAAVLLGLGGVTLAAGPASASWNACPVNRFCIWDYPNYWGGTFFANAVRNVCHSSASWASSVRNTTDDHVHIYLNSTCTNTRYDLYPGQSSPNMAGFGGSDNMRSWMVLS